MNRQRCVRHRSHTRRGYHARLIESRDAGAAHQHADVMGNIITRGDAYRHFSPRRMHRDPSTNAELELTRVSSGEQHHSLRLFVIRRRRCSSVRTHHHRATGEAHLEHRRRDDAHRDGASSRFSAARFGGGCYVFQKLSLVRGGAVRRETMRASCEVR